MNNNTVGVVAILIAQENKAGEMKKLLEGMIEPTRKEKGCIRYELYQDVNDVNCFTFIEEWECLDSLENHKNTPHYIHLKDNVSALLAGEPKVHLLNKLR